MSLDMLTTIHYLFQLKLFINSLIAGLGLYLPAVIESSDKRIEPYANALLSILEYFFLYLSFDDVSFKIGLSMYIIYFIGLFIFPQYILIPQENPEFKYMSLDWKQAFVTLDTTLRFHGVIKLAECIGPYAYLAILPTIYCERILQSST